MFKLNFENNDLAYDIALKVAFDGNTPKSFKNVPSFAACEDLSYLMKDHFVNNDAMEELKKLLWLFHKQIPHIYYCPMLIRVLGVLLMFLTESETFVVARRMVEESVKLLDERKQIDSEDMRGLRWHFTLNEDIHYKFIKSFSNFVRDKYANWHKIEDHFKAIGFDYITYIAELLDNLFLGYLPLPMVIRIFGAYLNEGIKIYYRMGYAFLRLFKRKILAHSNPNTMADMLKEQAHKLDDAQAHKFFMFAYDLKLTNIKEKFSKMEKPYDIKYEKQAYLPNLSAPSHILESIHFEMIWEWLPYEVRNTNAYQLYTSKSDGWSLRTVLKKSEDYKDIFKGMLILIKTNKNTLIGAYVDHKFSPLHEDYVGSNDCFVFMLEPV